MTYSTTTRRWDPSSPFELGIYTTLIVNNLPEKKSAIVRTIKKLFGEDNIVGMSFGHAPKHNDDKQAGWCHIHPKEILIVWLLGSIELVYCETRNKTYPCFQGNSSTQ